MKKQVNMWIAIWLTLCLFAGLLTGCGVAAEESSTTASEEVTMQGEETTAESAETEAPTEAEPYTGPIYKAEWLDVELLVERLSEVSSGGDVLYLRGATEKDENGNAKQVIISCNLDGTGQQMVFEIEEQEKSPELSEGETYTCSSYWKMNADSDGNLIMMFMEYRYVYGQKMKTIYRLLKLDREGNELWSVDLPELVHPVEMICAGDHTIVTLESISENNGVLGPTEVLVYGRDGELKARHNTEIHSILGLCSHDDKAYLYDGPDPYYGDAKLREIDLETGEFGDEFGDGLEWYGKWIGVGCGYDLLTEDGGAIWGFNFDGNYSVKVLDYALSGLFPQNSNVMIPMGESDFLMITGVRSYNNTQPQMALLTRATRENVEVNSEKTAREVAEEIQQWAKTQLSKPTD